MVRREISAGCVIYRPAPDGPEVALIRPRGKAAWALPKGLLEEGETAASAARREAEEETGITGELGARIDSVKYTYTAAWETPPARVFKIVTFYLMRATGGDPARHDLEVDEVAWVALDDAIRRASYGGEKSILRKAKELLGDVTS